MSDDDDLLVDGTVAVDGCCDQLCEGLRRVGVQIVGFELAEAASRQIDRQTWCGIDEAGEEGGELCDRATQAMDEDQQGDVGRQLAGLRVRMVDRPDLWVCRRAGGVRRVGGVLAEQAWVGRLGWSSLVFGCIGLFKARSSLLTVVLARGTHLYDAPRPEDGYACCRCGYEGAPRRGKRWDSRWDGRHFFVGGCR